MEVTGSVVAGGGRRGDLKEETLNPPFAGVSFGKPVPTASTRAWRTGGGGSKLAALQPCNPMFLLSAARKFPSLS